MRDMTSHSIVAECFSPPGCDMSLGEWFLKVNVLQFFTLFGTIRPMSGSWRWRHCSSSHYWNLSAWQCAITSSSFSSLTL